MGSKNRIAPFVEKAHGPNHEPEKSLNPLPVRKRPHRHGALCSCGGIVDEASTCNKCKFNYSLDAFFDCC